VTNDFVLLMVQLVVSNTV